jgi:hypothetical protein
MFVNLLSRAFRTLERSSLSAGASFLFLINPWSTNDLHGIALLKKTGSIPNRRASTRSMLHPVREYEWKRISQFRMALTGKPWQAVEDCQIAASLAPLANLPFFAALPCAFQQPWNLRLLQLLSLRLTLP